MCLRRRRRRLISVRVLILQKKIQSKNKKATLSTHKSFYVLFPFVCRVIRRCHSEQFALYFFVHEKICEFKMLRVMSYWSFDMVTLNVYSFYYEFISNLCFTPLSSDFPALKSTSCSFRIYMHAHAQTIQTRKNGLSDAINHRIFGCDTIDFYRVRERPNNEFEMSYR